VFLLTVSKSLDDRRQECRDGGQGTVQPNIYDSSCINLGFREIGPSALGRVEARLTLQSRKAKRMCAEYRIKTGMAAQSKCRNLPLFTTAPASPLLDLFILSRAISRSCSLKKVVDSGRFGRKKNDISPSRTAGVPCRYWRIWLVCYMFEVGVGLSDLYYE
jgi:hypothetical protein